MKKTSVSSLKGVFIAAVIMIGAFTEQSYAQDQESYVVPQDSISQVSLANKFSSACKDQDSVRFNNIVEYVQDDDADQSIMSMLDILTFKGDVESLNPNQKKILRIVSEADKVPVVFQINRFLAQRKVWIGIDNDRSGLAAYHPSFDLLALELKSKREGLVSAYDWSSDKKFEKKLPTFLMNYFHEIAHALQEHLWGTIHTPPLSPYEQFLWQITTHVQAELIAEQFMAQLKQVQKGHEVTYFSSDKLYQRFKELIPMEMAAYGGKTNSLIDVDSTNLQKMNPELYFGFGEIPGRAGNFLKEKLMKKGISPRNIYLELYPTYSLSKAERSYRIASQNSTKFAKRVYSSHDKNKGYQPRR